MYCPFPLRTTKKKQKKNRVFELCHSYFVVGVVVKVKWVGLAGMTHEELALGVTALFITSL